MEIIAFGFLSILIIIYGIKGISLYKSYKDTILQDIFPNFIEYYFRNAIRNDCSTSSFLNNKLGKHRIHFTTIQGNNHDIAARFIIIIYNKGIACINYLNPHGEISGKEKDKYWIIKRENKAFRITNPEIETQKYIKRLLALTNFDAIIGYQTVPNNVDTSNIKGNVYHYNAIVSILQTVNLSYIDDKKIIELYNSLLKPIIS